MPRVSYARRKPFQTRKLFRCPSGPQFLIILTILIFKSIGLAETSDSRFYCVKKSDSLSLIAQDSFGTPIYASKGSLNKIKTLNPQISNLDLIFPDEAVLVIDQKKDRIENSEMVCPQMDAPQDYSLKAGSQFLIKLALSLKNEDYQLKSKVVPFEFSATSKILYSFSAETCSLGPFCIYLDASSFSIAGNNTVQFKNSDVNLISGALKVIAYENDPIKFLLQAGVEEIPSFEVLETNVLTINKSHSRFLGLSLEVSYNRFLFDFLLCHLGLVLKAKHRIRTSFNIPPD